MTVIHDYQQPIQDVDRPDMDQMPKMYKIAQELEKEVQGLASFLKVVVDDNLMSSIGLKGSFDARETWQNGYIENSRYFLFHVVPAKEQRYYEGGEVSVSLLSGNGISKFRKYTGPVRKVIAKIQFWMGAEKLLKIS